MAHPSKSHQRQGGGDGRRREGHFTSMGGKWVYQDESTDLLGLEGEDAAADSRGTTETTRTGRSFVRRSGGLVMGTASKEYKGQQVLGMRMWETMSTQEMEATLV